MRDIIDIEQGKKDIKKLDEKLKEYAQEWEYNAFSDDEKSIVAQKEVILVLSTMDKYKGFIFEYNESEYTNPQYNEWYQDQHLSENELYNYDISEDNYGLADAVACDIGNELITYIKKQIIAQMPRIELIGILCEIERYQTIYEFFDKETALNKCDLDFFVQISIEETKEMIIEELVMIK